MKTTFLTVLICLSSLASASECIKQLQPEFLDQVSSISKAVNEIPGYQVGAVLVDGSVREVQLLKRNENGNFIEETSIKLRGTISMEDMNHLYRILNGGVESISIRDLSSNSTEKASDYEVGAVLVDGTVREVQLLKRIESGSFTEETSVKLKGTISMEDMNHIYRILNGGVKSISIRSL